MNQKTETSYKEICQRLSQLTTPLICDALPTVRLMDADINSFNDENQPCIGRAYPINSAQDSLSTMQALDDLAGFLNYLDCSSNDIVPIILLIASCNTKLALAGGMCTEVAKGKCAKSGTKDKIGTIRETIECGGVTVNPGDIDIDGIVVMNKEEAITAIEKGEDIQKLEAIALQRIKDGARFDEICNLTEHMENIKAGTPSKLHFTF